MSESVAADVYDVAAVMSKSQSFEACNKVVLPNLLQVYQLDMESAFYRPPPYVDGTPNESVQDVLVRVRQLMSILETQYQGDQVVIVSPDSDNLSILQVRPFAFGPLIKG
jgi:hypothetical protein